jgi:hypothetical protein
LARARTRAGQRASLNGLREPISAASSSWASVSCSAWAWSPSPPGAQGCRRGRRVLSSDRALRLPSLQRLATGEHSCRVSPSTRGSSETETSAHPAVQQAVAAGSRKSSSPDLPCLSPVVDYHGLGSRHRLPLRLPMRPQLNGATLARQERHRELGSRDFLDRAATGRASCARRRSAIGAKTRPDSVSLAAWLPGGAWPEPDRALVSLPPTVVSGSRVRLQPSRRQLPHALHRPGLFRLRGDRKSEGT